MSKEDDDYQLAVALSLSEAKQSSSSMTEQEKAFFSNSPLDYKRGGNNSKDTSSSSSSSSGRVYGHRGAYHAMGSPSSSSNSVQSGVRSSGFYQAEGKSRTNTATRKQEDIDRDFALALKFQEDEKEAMYIQQQQNTIPNRRIDSSSYSSRRKQAFNQQQHQSSTYMGLGIMDSSKCGGGSVLGGCGWPLLAGQIVTFNGIRFHAGCFKCAHCQRPISGPFQLHAPPHASGVVLLLFHTIYFFPRSIVCFTLYPISLVDDHVDDGSDTLNAPSLPYHGECADHLFVPTCSLCPEKLKGEFYRHPFFPERYHRGRCIASEFLPNDIFIFLITFRLYHTQIPIYAVATVRCMKVFEKPVFHVLGKSHYLRQVKKALVICPMEELYVWTVLGQPSSIHQKLNPCI